MYPDFNKVKIQKLNQKNINMEKIELKLSWKGLIQLLIMVRMMQEYQQ